MAHIQPPPNAETLRSNLNYDPRTGLFTWRAIASNRAPRIGAIAGSRSSKGYILVGVGGKQYSAHRLAWLYVHGEWPGQIDHIDGDKTNNRIANLRCVTDLTNRQNVHAAKRNNRCGLLGVQSHRSGGFVARIKAHGKQHYLGYFRTAEAAHEAYLQAKRGLHPGWIPRKEMA